MEIVRQVVRKVIKSDSRLYLTLNTILNFMSTVVQDGVKTYCLLRSLETREGEFSDGLPRPVPLRNLRYPILIRPGTQDSAHVINNIVREEYGHSIAGEPDYIIDAGAYIGDTATYFLSRFPQAKVIALEPNPDSYEMAMRNLEPYGERVILLQKGLFSDEKVHFFSGSGTGAAIASSGFEIECTTIPSLLEQYSIPRIGILKMDIEGAEEAIFLSKPEDWLDRVDLLIIEIHGPHIESLIRRVMKENGFSMTQYRSVWYCQRLDR